VLPGCRSPRRRSGPRGTAWRRRRRHAEVVALQEQADLRVRELLGDVLADDLALDGVVGLPAEGVGVLSGWSHSRAPEETNRSGHLLLVEEVEDRAVRRGAEAAEDAKTSSCRTSWLTTVEVLAGL
jgi:hypothetical protein